MEIIATLCPPSPVTFQKFLLQAANERGLSANDALGAVVYKMTRDLRVMPMIQFRGWYEQKLALLEKAKEKGGLFSYAQIILSTEERDELEQIFRWRAPSPYDRPVYI